MSTSSQLATMIDIVAPRVDPALVCRDNMDSIRAIARVISSWQCAGFECRLGNPAPRADFGVHLRRTHGIPIDTEVLGEDGSREGGTGEAWQRLRRFAGAWCEKESILWRAVPAVSLEFDVHSPAPTRVAAPSIFFSMRFAARDKGANPGAVHACSSVMRSVLEGLGVDAAGAAHKLEECFRVLLPRVPFLQLGVWLARPGDTFRICAPGLRLRDINDVVRALRWSGPSDAYYAKWRDLLQFADRGALHLDVGTDIGARLGIEVNFGEASASLNPHDPEDTRFFDYLVENDLCLPEKRDAVLSWVGAFRLPGGVSEPAAMPLFLRTISHVKLVFQPDRAPEAKAYLAVGRVDSQTRH